MPLAAASATNAASIFSFGPRNSTLIGLWHQRSACAFQKPPLSSMAFSTVPLRSAASFCMPFTPPLRSIHWHTRPTTWMPKVFGVFGRLSPLSNSS